MCGQMRWVGPHEICDRRSPTKALHISAELLQSPGLYRAGHRLLPHIRWASRHEPTGWYSRLLSPLGLSGHDRVMGAVWVNSSTESKNTWDQTWDKHTHYSANVTHCWWTWIWPQTTTMSSINYGCELLGCQVLIPILLFCFYQPLDVFKYFPNAFQVWFIFCIMWLKYK